MKVIGEFRDRAIYDSAEKTAISVRDGVLEYLGSEIGYEPADKVFRVFRSSATIANAASLMTGIPLTNDHVSLDSAVSDSKGEVISAKMVDLKLEELGARLGIVNKLRVDSDMLAYLDAGKRELSLGYRASLVEASAGSDFDLEQIEILPHHLAVVDAGRCGSVCSFIDRKGKTEMKLNKVFLDADGNPSMTEIVAIAQALPEALKSLPVDELAKVLPVLQQIVASSGVNEEPATEEIEGEGVVAPAEEVAKVADETEEEKTATIDSAAFKDALKASVARHVAIMDKARQFLPETYKFSDKDSNKIMRDALATEYGNQKFADGELDVAFKMLKKNQSQYRNFGDGAAVGKFTKLADKEI